MAELNLNREDMHRQEPAVRVKNYNEVALGYTPEQAKAEATRCIQCPKPKCLKGCPVGIDIPAFIQAIVDDDMPKAVQVLKDKNSLPGICGRVCPQETQCEEVCVLDKKGAPVAIGRLERYVADWEREHLNSIKQEVQTPSKTDKKVAVIGAGPAGLVAAADLAKMGHEVVLYEALHTAGGVLTYGIPEFRLPKAIVKQEVEYIESLGVKIEYDSVVGKIFTLDELLEEGNDAVFLGTGAGAPIFLNIEGENLNGVYSANEFLTRVNLMKAYKFPEFDTPIKVGKKIVVIGGGNVAMDAARCAIRLGAGKVTVIYRRSDAEMPARREEIDNAKEEGIEFKMLTGPKRLIDDGKGWVNAMECYQMELGEPDESGRRRPVIVDGKEFILDADMVITALGTMPNPLIAQTTPGLEVSSKGVVITDEETGKTSKEGIWAGGDISTGAATVISAMGAARKAALDIDKYLKEK